jgi:hypothetical protein
MNMSENNEMKLTYENRSSMKRIKKVTIRNAYKHHSPRLSKSAG